MKDQTNARIKMAAEKNNVYLWEIAERFGVSDCWFSKMLRHEFSPEKTQMALKFIDEIAAARALGDGAGV